MSDSESSSNDQENADDQVQLKIKSLLFDEPHFSTRLESIKPRERKKSHQQQPHYLYDSSIKNSHKNSERKGSVDIVSFVDKELAAFLGSSSQDKSNKCPQQDTNTASNNNNNKQPPSRAGVEKKEQPDESSSSVESGRAVVYDDHRKTTATDPNVGTAILNEHHKKLMSFITRIGESEDFRNVSRTFDLLIGLEGSNRSFPSHKLIIECYIPYIINKLATITDNESSRLR